MSNNYGINLTTTAVTNQNVISASIANNVEFNGTARIIQTCDFSEQDSLIAGLGSAHPTLAGYILSNREVEQIPGGLCRATLDYTNSYQSLPSPSFNEQSSIQEAPITDHANFPTWTGLGYWDFTNKEFLPSSPFYGVTSFRIASATVTKVEYFDSIPSSRFDDITKLEAPDSSYGDASLYMIVGSNRRQQNANWTRETIYEYGAWNTGIYSAV